ncbi:MAG: translocation/assembly module TamB domain-containing protein [candidate division WOR-3 bacterium]
MNIDAHRGPAKGRQAKAPRRYGCPVAVAILLMLALLLFLFRQHVGRLVIDLALRQVSRSISGRITYGRLSGNVFSTPTFECVAVVFGSDSVKARALTLTYEPFGFLRGRLPLSEVEILEPSVFLSVKNWSSEPSRDGVPTRVSFPRLALRQLHVSQGSLYVDGQPRAESLELVLSIFSNPSVVEARFVRASGRLVQERVCVGDISTLCRITPDSLVLDSMTVLTAGSRLTGNLRFALDGSGGDAVLENLSVDIAEFATWPGRVVVRGNVRQRGKTRSGELGYAAEGMLLGRIRLPTIRGRLTLTEPELRVEASGKDPALGEFELSGSFELTSSVFEARASMRNVAVRRVEPALPDVRVQADIRAMGRGIDSIAVMAGVRVRELGIDTLVVSGEWRKSGEKVSRASGSVDMRGPAGWLWASCEWHAVADKWQLLDFRCAIDSLDVGLVGSFFGMPAAGRLKGLVTGAGGIDSIELKGGVRATGLEIASMRFEQGLAEFDIAVGRALRGRLMVGVEGVMLPWLGSDQPGRLSGTPGLGPRLPLALLQGKGDREARNWTLDAAQLTLQDAEFDLRVDRPEDQLLAGGLVRLGRDGVDCEVNRFQFATREETLALDEPFVFILNRDSVAVRDVRYHVADGTLELHLVQSGRSLPMVQVQGKKLNLRKLQKLARLPFEIWGTWNFEVSGQDSFQLRMRTEDLELPSVGLMVKDLVLDLMASRTEALVRQLWFVHARDTTVLSGRVSYELSPRVALKDVDFSADIADPGTWVLAFLRPTLELSEGQLYGQLRWRGGVSEPNLTGRLRVVAGTLSVPAINMKLDRVNAELAASADRIELEKLSAASGAGLVTATGFVDLGEDWLVDSLRYRIRPDGATISPLPEVYAVVAGDLTISWQSHRPLSLEGTLDVEEALLAFGFGPNQTAVQSSSSKGDSVVYDLRVRGERAIWLRNPLADIELSGDLQVRQTMSEETYSGRLSSRQGNIYYLDHTLRVTQGEIRFDNIDRLNPSLNIRAELPVHRRVGTDGTAPDRIVLTISGTLEKPEFRLEAEPRGWDESQIVTYLSLNVTAEELAGLESRQAATRYLSERLLGYFQTQATKRVRNYIGLDELSFESAFAGGEGYKVTVGKYVARDLYFTYTQNFTGAMQPAFTVEYYLDRRSEIVGNKSEEGRYSVRYRFKLRY